MVYVEHVGIKRQLGGKRGEIQYWYPRTNPIKTRLKTSPTFMSCVAGRAAIASKRCYCHGDIPGMLTGEAGTYSQNNIRSRRILLRPKSERLPNNSFEPVSLHCATNLTMNAYPQPAVTCRIFPADKGEAFTVRTSSTAVDVLELPFLAKQSGLGQTFTGQRLSRKSLAALRPPRRQHRSASAGAHSLTEAVDMFAFDIAWLESSLAHSLLPRLEKSMGLPHVSFK